MARNIRERAYEVYCTFCAQRAELGEDVFTSISSCLESYLRAVIRGRVYNCSPFDLDDYLAEAQLALWQAMKARRLPIDSPALFLAAVRVTVQQTVIDVYRRLESDRRGEQLYTDMPISAPSHPPERAHMRDILTNHRDYIVLKMEDWSRFGSVDHELCDTVVGLFLDDAPVNRIMEVLNHVRFWDPEFLLSYLLVLFHRAYEDLRDESVLGETA